MASKHSSLCGGKLSLNYATLGLFKFIFVFSTNCNQLIKVQLNLPKTGFEAGSSGIVGDHAVHCAPANLWKQMFASDLLQVWMRTLMPLMHFRNTTRHSHQLLQNNFENSFFHFLGKSNWLGSWIQLKLFCDVKFFLHLTRFKERDQRAQLSRSPK